METDPGFRVDVRFCIIFNFQMSHMMAADECYKMGWISWLIV